MDMPPRRASKPTAGAGGTTRTRAVTPTGDASGARRVSMGGEQRIAELKHKLRNAQQRCAMGDRMACMAVSQLSQSLAEAERASQPKRGGRGPMMGQRHSGGGGGGGLGMSYGAARQMMLGGGG